MRAPFNVLVIPSYRAPDAETRYCVLRRADAGFWQWVAGGGEDAQGEATPPLGVFTSVSAARDKTCGITTNKTVVCWGDVATR